MATYNIDTETGHQLCAGLPEYTAYRTAQQRADMLGESVTLYDPADLSRSRTVEPTEIVVDLDGPNGPRVTYGAKDVATVEACLPEGWNADWSRAVDLTPSGTHRIAHSAPLVEVARCECGTWSGVRCEHVGPVADLVTVEWMPEYLRASCVAANNRGTYPHNGAVRLRVELGCADVIIDEAGDWATRL